MDDEQIQESLVNTVIESLNKVIAKADNSLKNAAETAATEPLSLKMRAYVAATEKRVEEAQAIINGLRSHESTTEQSVFEASQSALVQ